jgi:hypothetical protein
VGDLLVSIISQPSTPTADALGFSKRACLKTGIHLGCRWCGIETTSGKIVIGRLSGEVVMKKLIVVGLVLVLLGVLTVGCEPELRVYVTDEYSAIQAARDWISETQGSYGQRVAGGWASAIYYPYTGNRGKWVVKFDYLLGVPTRPEESIWATAYVAIETEDQVVREIYFADRHGERTK